MENAVMLSIELAAEPLDCTMSPTSPLLATALVDGQLLLHSYTHMPNQGSTSKPTLLQQLQHSITACEQDESCRCVCFTADGKQITVGSSDHSMRVFDAASGKRARLMEQAHAESVSRVTGLQGNLLASGDESGVIKVWDLRSNIEVMTYKKHKDYITDFGVHSKEMCLIATSGDGTLSVHDLRTRKFRCRTEDDADDELLSVAVMKGGKKLVCGSQSGVLNLYSWGAMKDCSDRYPGHPESVSALVAFDDDTVISGSSDGMIRILSILPNKLLGVLGEHVDMPVERLALSMDRCVLASASHDQTIKLWDLSYLVDDDGDDGDESDDEDGSEIDDELVGEGDAGEGDEEEGDDFEVDEISDMSDQDGDDSDMGADEGYSDDDGAVMSDGVGNSTASEGSQEETGSQSGGLEDDADIVQGLPAMVNGKAGHLMNTKSRHLAAAKAPHQDTSSQCNKAATHDTTLRVQAAAAGDAGDQGPCRLHHTHKPNNKVKHAEAGGQGVQPNVSATGLSGIKKLRMKAQQAESDSDNDSAESDSDDGGSKKRRDKRLKTKWSTQSEKQKQRDANNFFADLL